MVAPNIYVNVEVTGGPSLEAAILNAFSNLAPELEGSLIEEGERVMTASKEIVPVDTGDLKNSGGYYGTESSPDGVYVRYGYGGSAASYALLQHETPPQVFRHAEGQSWKYLEFPLMDAVQGMGQRLASSLSARLSARFSGAGGGGGGTFGGE